MASHGAEHEEAINDWIQSFERLPEDRQDNIKRWFATQKIIIENSGLSPEEWFKFIEWAMDNPFDYSFVLEFPDVGEEGGAEDSAARSDETRSAREMVGAEGGKTPLADGPGITEKAKSDKKLERELFDEFMKNKLGGGGRR